MIRPMLAHYAQQYERLWKQHWWWQARKAYVLAHLQRLARQHPLKQILDIGCGNGLFFDDLARFGQVRGIEPDAGLVTPNNRWAEHIQCIGFGPDYQTTQRFDLILMLDVLEHIQDDRGAARHVFDLLKPGGMFLLTVPALMLLWSRHDVANAHVRRYTRPGVRTVLQNAGFDIQELRYFCTWTLPPLLGRRLLLPDRQDQGEKDYMIQPPPRWLNSMLYALTRFDHHLWHWCGAPIGSSLLAVGVKR